ncbi:MAG: tail fiber domain-containing protein [Candidatus Altimarinota bacterium]
MKIQKKIAMLTLGLLSTTTFSAGVLQAAPGGNPPGSNTPAATFSSVSVSAATAVAGLFSGAFAAGSILQGINTSATGGSTAVSGVSSGGPGVSGTSSAAGWAGVQGSGGANGNGVYGSTSSASAASYGLSGLATSGRGVFGTSTSNDGVYGTSNSGAGVRAYSAGSTAIIANVSNGGGNAILGYRNNTNGVGAVVGQMTAQTVGAGGGYAVVGQSLDATAAVGDRGTGVYGFANTGTGVLARSGSGTGLNALSDATGNAITAQNASTNNYTATFFNTSSGPGISVGNTSSSYPAGTFTNSGNGGGVYASTASTGSSPAGRFTKGSNIVDVGSGNNALDVTGTSIFRSPSPYTGSYLQFLNGQDAAANYHVVLRSYNQSGTLQPVWINDVMTNNITTTGVSGGALNIVSDGSAFFRTTSGGTVNFGAGDTSILLNQAVSNNTVNNSGYVYVNDNFRTTGTNDMQGDISNSAGNLSLNDSVDITGSLTATGSVEIPTIRTSSTGFRAYSSGYFYAGGFASIDGEIYARAGISNNDTAFQSGYLYIDDSIRINSATTQKLTNTAWTTWSDGRLKDVQKTFDKGLAEILKIDPIIYKYKKDNTLGIKDDEDHVGIIAQEIQKVFPEAVTTDERGLLQFTPDSIYWAMLNAIKELNSNDEVLKAKVTALEAQNRALEARLSALEAKLK